MISSFIDPRGLLQVTCEMVAIGTLRALKAIGVNWEMVDFDTGCSSLPCLKRFPFDVLKIDRSFVHNIALNADDVATAASIIPLLHGTNLDVIAEAVGTQKQLTYLCEHSCDQMQGCYFSKPLPVKTFERVPRMSRGLLSEFESASA